MLSPSPVRDDRPARHVRRPPAGSAAGRSCRSRQRAGLADGASVAPAQEPSVTDSTPARVGLAGSSRARASVTVAGAGPDVAHGHVRADGREAGSAPIVGGVEDRSRRVSGLRRVASLTRWPAAVAPSEAGQVGVDAHRRPVHVDPAGARRG